MQIEKFFKDKDEEALQDVLESTFRMKVIQMHANINDQLLDGFQMKSIDGVNDKDFDSVFVEIHVTDEDNDNIMMRNYNGISFHSSVI